MTFRNLSTLEDLYTIVSIDTYVDRKRLKFYSRGQSVDAQTNQRYHSEFYDTLLFGLCNSRTHATPCYAKVLLDAADFNYSQAHIDHDFLYHEQQPEMFASQVGSWSDVHIGMVLNRLNLLRYDCS